MKDWDGKHCTLWTTRLPSGGTNAFSISAQTVTGAFLSSPAASIRNKLVFLTEYFLMQYYFNCLFDANAAIHSAIPALQFPSSLHLS